MARASRNAQSTRRRTPQTLPPTLALTLALTITLNCTVKPENLLLTSKEADAAVKLVDFGLACEIRSHSDAKPGTWACEPPPPMPSFPMPRATPLPHGTSLTRLDLT